MPPTTENVAYQKEKFRPPTGQHRQGPIKEVRSFPGRRRKRDVLTSAMSRPNVVPATVDDEDFISNESKYRQEFFFKEPSIYTHRIFVRATKIFSSLKQDPNESGSPYMRRKQMSNAPMLPTVADEEFKDDIEKRKTYELAFTALKYQGIFETIVEECSFFAYHPEVKESQALVMVMLCDFQSRKYQYRIPFPGEELDDECLEVEKAILDFKTKLNACVARHRIKARAPSIEYLLPEQVRVQEQSNKFDMPVYMWVNQHKTNVADVIATFTAEGYEQDEEGRVLDLQEKKFIVDHHCPDMLVFSSDDSHYLHEHHLTAKGHIVMQDKSSCLAPHSIKHLLNEDDDVIHVNVGSGLTTAHLSSLLKGSGTHIYAYGATTDTEAYRLHHNLDHLGVKNVRIMSEDFMDVEGDDSRLKTARVVLVTAECSKSGVTNPVEFVISEGEDMRILRDLSLGESNTSRLGEFTSRHNFWLRQALKLPKVQAVVYMTRSVFDAENDNVVMKAVEYMNMVQNKKCVPFRLVPPVVPFSADEIEASDGIIGKFVKYKPSAKMNGCFLAVITREPEDIRDVAREVIARATAKGLLGKKGGSNQSLDRKGNRRRSPKRIRESLSMPTGLTAGFPKQNLTVDSPVSHYINSSLSRASLHHHAHSRKSHGSRQPRSNPSIKSITAPQGLTPEQTRVKHPAPFR